MLYVMDLQYACLEGTFIVSPWPTVRR